MASCNEMKKGDLYACQACGFEFEVKTECNCTDIEECTPQHDHKCCEFECCGQPMAKK